MTTLEAIQTIARRVGERPPAALDNDGFSKAADIKRVLDDEEMRIQGDGWAYNRFENVTLSRDVNNQIAVPAGTLWIDSDASSGWVDAVQRGEYMYDRKNNSTTFTADLVCTYLTRFEFPCIPVHVQQYIVACAARRYNEERRAPDPDKKAVRDALAGDEMRARVAALRLDQDNADVNVLHTADVLKVRGRTDHTGIFETLLP